MSLNIIWKIYIAEEGRKEGNRTSSEKESGRVKVSLCLSRVSLIYKYSETAEKNNNIQLKLVLMSLERRFAFLLQEEVGDILS